MAFTHKDVIRIDFWILQVVTKKKLAQVKKLLEKDERKHPTKPRQTGRANDAGLKKTSFFKACHLLKKGSYKLKKRPRGKKDGSEIPERLEFCDLVVRQPDEFFEKYICTDESAFR